MSEPAGPVAALRASQDRLVSLVARLDPADYTAQAYPKEWTIAAVLSHLGSGAEITTLAFDAALAGQEAPGREANPPIGTGGTPRRRQPRSTTPIEANERLVERSEALDADQRATVTGLELDDLRAVFPGL